MSHENVLVFPSKFMEGLPPLHNGFMPDAGSTIEAILAPDGPCEFRLRDTVEDDPTYLQVIPYVVFRNRQGRFLTYERGGKGGESRLHARRSMGFGGHINDSDSVVPNDAFAIGTMREIAEELNVSWNMAGDSPMSILYTPTDSVGRVHIGFVMILDATRDEVSSPDPAVLNLRWSDQDEILADPSYEDWSRILINNLV